ncbi:MAG: SLATT domain-containing protein [Nostoc sp. JL33]|uniref:SLATT domain-containing protein n=2 Tax=Nostoc TaxID=1177 RepID=UPI0025FFD67B|nr:SLATT domain-containing protein [Nostoc sp. JL33]MBN3874509.1 SLATT domain-containing protein [Nostoc sp. JL33]
MKMNTSPAQIQHLLNECKIIEENSLYTSQAHFQMANKAEFQARLFLIVPSCIAAVSGVLTAIGFPSWIGAFAAVSGLITGLASVFGVDRKAGAHKQAGNVLTALRHEARALHEAYWRELPHEQFVAEVRRIHDKYNSLIQTLETTDNAAFEEGRNRIKAGLFEPDFQKK